VASGVIEYPSKRLWTMGVQAPFGESQNVVVAAVLDHVVVGPGRLGYNRFDPSRLSPVWRL
jgi:hypothetical protein